MNATQQESYTPEIGTTQIELLKRLSNACSVSGDEGEVRAIVLEHVRPYGQVKVDALGNVLVTCPAQGASGQPALRVMLAAHMDEVGLMLSYDEEEGIFRFETIGGVDPRQLVGKSVWVGHNHSPGVIGVKPIHLTTADERKRTLSLDMLRVDVGPGNANRVKVGDWATFATSFSQLGPSVRGKALDNRLGVTSLIELVKHAPPNIELLAAFTVQEEVGLRGAHVAAYALDPDLAIVMDCTPANDLPGSANLEEYLGFGEKAENTRYNSRLGAGPAIYIADRETFSDPRLVRYMVETAKSVGIPYQFRQPGGGGTDAGAIHKQRLGIPSISISTPGRYLHTAASITRVSDWENTLALVYHALTRLVPDILSVAR